MFRHLPPFASTGKSALANLCNSETLALNHKGLLAGLSVSTFGCCCCRCRALSMGALCFPLYLFEMDGDKRFLKTHLLQILFHICCLFSPCLDLLQNQFEIFFFEDSVLLYSLCKKRPVTHVCEITTLSHLKMVVVQVFTRKDSIAL